MTTVTLIGADGSGKSTLADALVRQLPVPCERLYMGVSRSSSNRMLVTTRLLHAVSPKTDEGGPPDADQRLASRRPGVVAAMRRAAHVGVLITEECYRQIVSSWLQARGRLVIYDRHFFIDYYAHDITNPTSPARRVHGWWLRWVYPKPGLVLFLDAPADVVLGRKGEGTVTALEARRREYHAIRAVLPDVVVIDATRSPEAVAAEALREIEAYRKRRAGRQR